MTTKQEIVDLLIANKPSFSLFEEQIKNKDVILLAGLTRSGKSTLANCLIGNQLTSIHERKKVFKIKCDDPRGAYIGQGCVSTTSAPGVYTLSDDTVIVDAPGLGDNRGDAQVILNSVFISKIGSSKTVKIILVSDIAHITGDYIGNFLFTLRHLHEFVPNLMEKINSFAVVFTKDSDEFTQDEIIELLKEKIFNDDKLQADRELVKHFVDNPHLIGIFRMPSSQGVISSSDELTINVKGAVDSCVATATGECVFQVSFSDTAKNTVSKIFAEYAATITLFEPHVNKVIDKYIKYFTVNDYVFASYDVELCELKCRMFSISIKLQNESWKEFSFLREIIDSISLIYPENDRNEEFYKRFQLISDLDKFAVIPRESKNTIIHNYKETVIRLKNKVQFLINKIEKEQLTRSSQNIAFTRFIGLSTFLGGAALVMSINAAAAIPVAGTAVAAITIFAAIVFYKQRYGVRYEARKDQKRPETAEKFN